MKGNIAFEQVVAACREADVIFGFDLAQRRPCLL